MVLMQLSPKGIEASSAFEKERELKIKTMLVFTKKRYIIELGL